MSVPYLLIFGFLSTPGRCISITELSSQLYVQYTDIAFWMVTLTQAIHVKRLPHKRTWVCVELEPRTLCLKHGAGCLWFSWKIIFCFPRPLPQPLGLSHQLHTRGQICLNELPPYCLLRTPFAAKWALLPDFRVNSCFFFTSAAYKRVWVMVQRPQGRHLCRRYSSL